MPAQPVALLLLLLRHAALRQYLDSAAELLTPENGIQPSERIEAELMGLSSGLPRPTPWEILGRPLNGNGSVGAHLDASRTDPSIADFASFWSAFQTLTTLSAESLDAATREVMDLASYRLDAWFTSMAHFRLERLRAATPNGGVVLGAYLRITRQQCRVRIETVADSTLLRIGMITDKWAGHREADWYLNSWSQACGRGD